MNARSREILTLNEARKSEKTETKMKSKELKNTTTTIYDIDPTCMCEPTPCIPIRSFVYISIPHGAGR